MASNSNFQLVSLTESDVPGAKLTYSMVEKHSIVQLKRWLQCRDIKCSGNKKDLVQRVKDCIDAGADKNISLSVDGGKWYSVKEQQLQKQRPTNVTSLPPITGWNNFPSVNLPKHFNHGHIHHHIVESVQFVGQSDCGGDSNADPDIEDLHTAKPMKKGEDYFKSGHVQGMKDRHKEGIYFLKAVVLASYEVSVQYDVMVLISQESGFVKEGSCTCKASAMGRCAHITALLLALKDYIGKYGTEPASSTSKLCEWNKGRTKRKNPQNVVSASYPSSKKRKVDEIINYNPTPTFPERSEDKTLLDFISALETGSEQPTMWQSLLFRVYENYELDDIQKTVLKQKIQRMVSNMAVTFEQAPNPCEILEYQGTTEWYNERRIRVTASISKTIAQTKSVSVISNILKQKLWCDSHPTKAMKYGIENEENAFLDYKTMMKGEVSGSTVEKSGFWINSHFPQIGASPDGLVNDPREKPADGLLEIKCPLILQKQTVKDFDTVLTKKQLNNFCLEKKNGEVILKEKHAYYYQIQTQLGVLEKKWCDLVIWGSEGNLLTVRVRFDCSFWNNLKIKLISFHESWLAPEFFEMRIPRRLLPAQIEL